MGFTPSYGISPLLQWVLPPLMEYPHLYIYIYMIYKWDYMRVSINGATPIAGWFISWNMP
jgi:hypothetical protein